MWPAIGLAIILGAARSVDPDAGNISTWWRGIVQSWRRWLLNGLLVFGLGVLMASPWLMRNWALYGDPLGLSMAMRTIDVRTDPWSWADTTWLLRGWFVSFWGKFGGAGHIPMPTWIYGLLGLASLISLAGLGINLAPNRRRYALLPMTLLLIAIIGVGVVMWRYSLIALGTDQGRLLYPAIGALLIVFVAGLLSWVPARFERQIAIMLVCLMLALGAYALIGVIEPAFAQSGLVSE